MTKRAGPSVPSPLGLAPFFDHDVFWEKANALFDESPPPHIDGGLFLVEDDIPGDMGDMIEGDDIIRLSVERGAFRYAPLNTFGGLSPPIRGWHSWTSSVLGNEAFRQKLDEAGVLQCVELCGQLSVTRDERAMDLLVSRWCPQTSTFITSWGEFSPTLEDVYELYRLRPYGDVSYSPADFTREDIARARELAQASSDSSQYCSRWNGREFDQGDFPVSASRKPSWTAFTRYFHADFSPSGEDFNGSVLSWLGKESPLQLEAFVAFWLSRFLFGGLSWDRPLPAVFPLACMIARGVRLPLGPLFLGTLYARLGEVVSTMRCAKGT